MKALILAAGMGTRMNSKYPKVMHKVLGKPMINWVIDTASNICDSVGVVLGHKKELVEKIIPSTVITYEQKNMKGTGDAVMSASEFLQGDEVIVLYGDVPLISKETLESLVKKHKEENNDATLLSVFLEDPTGYGRIVRIDNRFFKIVEQKDATKEQLKLKEINSGIAVFNINKLNEALQKIDCDNAQNEYYLTDVFSNLDKVGILVTQDIVEVSGVNNRIQLSEMEKEAKKRVLNKLMENGVSIVDTETTYITPDVKIGQDTVIHPQTYISGNTTIGSDCQIGPLTRINNCEVEDNSNIFRSECEGAIIKSNVSVGPFSRLREGTIVESKSKIGNFVEIKKSHLHNGVKAGHLTYLGDADIGENTNIGAGTITCNYDGVNKHKTYIGKNAFIGSNSSLVAPVKIGEGSTTAAGSAITQDVPEQSLAFGRAKQVVKEGWFSTKTKKGE